jgi:Arc-like DNA binding domain
MARRKPADTVHLRLRFPEKLRRRIEAAATKNQQSMNAEIVERLERSFGQEDITATIEATAEATASAFLEQAMRDSRSSLSMRLFGIGPLGQDLSDLPGFDEMRADARKEAEERVIKLLIAQNPSLDEHAAREHLNTLVEKYARPIEGWETESPEERRARGLSFALKSLEAMKDESK